MTTTMTKEKEYAVGDKVWLVEGDLLIHCSVIEVDDSFRKKDAAAYLFYWLDEPIGHAIGADEMYDTFDQAKEVFEECVKNTKAFYEEEGVEYKGTSLEQSRNRTARFILATYLEGDQYGKKDLVKDQAVKDMLEESAYPGKEKGKEWFSGKEYFNL